MPDSLSTQNGPERSVILCLPKDVMSSPLSGINYILEGKKNEKKRKHDKRRRKVPNSTMPGRGWFSFSL